MALSQDLIDLLNKFADTQPALRLPGEPFGFSNPELGTALNDAIDAAAGSSSAADAASSASDAASSASDAASSAALAANGPYTPTTSADWDGDPTTFKEGLDRLAAVVRALNTDPIP